MRTKANTDDGAYTAYCERGIGEVRVGHKMGLGHVLHPCYVVVFDATVVCCLVVLGEN